MNNLTCHCGAIHYKLFNSSISPKTGRGISFVEASNPAMIEDPSKRLNTYSFESGPVKEYGFCNQCGAAIYQIDNRGLVQHAIHSHQNYLADYNGILNFGF
ncbi:hypothetical protein Misp06_01058 [Microbulbifer sp. NBRC 101763]|uniref:hypothetical protein n=1 Tax=unclassified Microbulbifer TaxID=2619833 RepID=UPI0024AE7093|nr:hypothetical protein [Microbulbifer sp. MLAF003]WHI49196.1 hypothetical protein P3339_11915 [Microbulbifer sp. MLAF003]